MKRGEAEANATTGQLFDVKQDGSKFKGVAVEPDGRRTKK